MGVDAAVERLLLEALTPDRLALAIAALGELENEARVLERQWSLKRERARYEAERARRQYDAVEPENRLVARSLERVWEDKLRQAEQIDIEYESWRRQQPISLAAADRAQIISLGEDLPKLWDAASVVERKQILRLVVKEVVLDQRPESGQVWIRIIWQTGAVSEHKVRRNVSSYRNYADVAALEARVRDLVVARKMDREIARALNADGLLSAHGRPFSGGEVHLLRKRWNIPTVKINRTEHNPRQWPDGTYSVQGAAEALSISTQTVFKWLQKGRLSGHQITKGMPWQINLPRLVCSLVSVLVFLLVFPTIIHPTLTPTTRPLIIRRWPITLHPPTLQRRHPTSHQALMRGRDKLPRRRSSIHLGPAGPTRRANIAGNTNRCRRPAMVPLSDMALLVRMRAASGAWSIDG